MHARASSPRIWLVALSVMVLPIFAFSRSAHAQWLPLAAVLEASIEESATVGAAEALAARSAAAGLALAQRGAAVEGAEFDAEVATRAGGLSARVNTKAQLEGSILLNPISPSVHPNYDAEDQKPGAFSLPNVSSSSNTDYLPPNFHIVREEPVTTAVPSRVPAYDNVPRNFHVEHAYSGYLPPGFHVEQESSR